MQGVMGMGAAAAVLLLGATASADLVLSNPGLYDDVDDFLEARVRLDGGNSQTWKTAFWQDTTMLQNSGVQQNVFSDETVYSFTWTYDAGAGLATISVSGLGSLDLTQSYELDPGDAIAGFQLYARSEGDGSTTLLSNLTASLDGGAAIAVDDLLSDGDDVFVTSTYYVDSATSSIALSGDFTFDWGETTNTQGERFKVGVKWLDGAPVPTPGALAALGLAGLAARRRRRA